MNNINLRQNTVLGTHQQQKLLMTTSMKQAFFVMQLPVLELAEWLRTEIENNPVLEIDLPRCDAPSKSTSQISRQQPRELLENLVASQCSLFDHLMTQARYQFSEQNDVNLAQWIIGHLNDRGFLTTSLEELSTLAPVDKLREILTLLQTFDPPGIGACNLQESLLIQLRLKQKQNGMAFQILQEHFEDLLNNRLPLISKGLGISVEAISAVIQEDIVPLDLHPGHRFLSHFTETITPDLYLYQIDENWKIEVNHSYLPAFHMARSYQEAIQNQQLRSDELACLKRYITAGKWIKLILQKRKGTLLKIGKFLLKHQSAFFQGGRLVPLTMSQAAQAVELHESTIARAVANKYIACPQGIFSLKDFFNHGVRGTEGEQISHYTLREKIEELVKNEDKKHPHSDEQISTELEKLGVSCSRRTVTKYRRLLSIPPAAKRKKWA